MKRIKLILTWFLFFVIVCGSFAQQSEAKVYMIISFEDTYKVSQHGTQTYFWITPLDSIHPYESAMSRLFISDLTAGNLQDCCSGRPFDPVVYEQNSDYSSDPTYLASLRELKEMVIKNRRRVQRITKKWDSGQSETITVYATPIQGLFCSSEYHPIGQKRTGYHGMVYVPKSSFSYFKQFWSSSKANYILKQDFSSCDFDIISN